MRTSNPKLLVPMSVAAILSPALTCAASAGEEASVGLEEIIVTARKVSEDVKNVPESITVLTQSVIESAGIANVNDIVTRTPNFDFEAQPTPGAYQFTVRGVSMAQGGEAPVAFVVDGVEVPDPLFINQELLNIAQIQVLRGPQGSLYGRNALAGAIIIDTRQPTNELTGSVKARFGNGAEQYFNGVLSGPIAGDTLSGTAAVSVHHFAGLIENNFLHQKADKMDDKTYLGRLVWKPTDGLTVAARVNLLTETDRVPTAEALTRDQFLDYDHSYLSENSQPIARQRLFDASLKVDYELGFATLTSITGYNSGKTNLFGDADFSPTPFLLQDLDRNVFSRSEELRLASSAQQVKWVLGGFFQNRDTLNALDIPFDDGNGAPIPGGGFLISSHDEGSSKSWAVFGQGTVTLLPRTDLTLGLRYDADKRSSEDSAAPGSAIAKTFSATQPKASLEYHWTDNFQSYVSAAKGFRSGGFNAFFSVGTPSRDYGQQVNKNYELGFKGVFFDRRLSIDGSVYHTDVSNQQLFFVNSNPPSQNVTTIDRVKINGGELEIAAEVARGLQLTAAAGVADAKIDSFRLNPANQGNRSPLSPSYTARFGINYTIPLSRGWDIVAYGNINRRGPIEWDTANTLSTGPRDDLDLRISLQSDHIFVTPYGKNLLNEAYPIYASVNGFGPGIHGRSISEGRLYGVEFGVRF